MEKEKTSNQDSKKKNFPPVYVIADLKSSNKQRCHFSSLFVQLIFLFIASLTTVLSSKLPFSAETVSFSYLSFIVLSMIFMLYSAFFTPEKKWYQSRALAESVNTLTWRFIMRAEPFHIDKEAEFHFRRGLHEIWDNNKMCDGRIDKSLEETSQITEWMKNVRESSFEEKKCRYCNERIQDQLSWYQQKTEFNKKRAVLFSVLSCVTYITALAVACFQCNNPKFDYPWLSESFLMAAAGLVGWTQAKRYSELASSYGLTFQDISDIKEEVGKITEEQFGDFVNDAETAFSREHTQWAARQIKITAEQIDPAAEPALKK